MGLTLVWTLFFDLSDLGDPTRGVNTPVGIALGVTGTHRPLSHVEATVPVSGCIDIIILQASIACMYGVWSVRLRMEHFTLLAIRALKVF